MNLCLQRPMVLSVEDKLAVLRCKFGLAIVDAEMDMTLAKSQGYLKNNLMQKVSSSGPFLAVFGVYTGFGSRLKGNGFRGSWMPKGQLRVPMEVEEDTIDSVNSLESIMEEEKDKKKTKNAGSEEHQEEVTHFNAIVKMRHQVNHFVSTLQQYVESQLSHVSWCRFLYSLKLKVTAIKQTFDKNMKELHSCYLKSPKHGEFGLPQFWEYLYYNKYYSDAASVVHSSVTRAITDKSGSVYT